MCMLLKLQHAQFKNLLNSLDPFEHDEDDSDDKDNLPPAHVQDHSTDVKVHINDVHQWLELLVIIYGCY